MKNARSIRDMQRQNKEKIVCPYLLKWTVSSCRASAVPYMPGLFELQEYCRSKKHKKCPFYLGVKINNFEVLV